MTVTPGLFDIVWYGGDYNPEQWPEEVWDDDIERMLEAGVTVVTLGVFSWAMLEAREGEFDFGWLDRIVAKLHAAGIRIDMATATASPPPWVTRNHPDTRPITVEGVALEAGSRQAYSPHSATFRALSLRLVRRIAERYAGHPAVIAWHVGNEYGCHVAHCYSDEGAVAFRRWLERRYGSIAELNAAWGTAFWSQRYDSFEEIIPPRVAPYLPNPTQALDFDRFSSDALLECYRAEVAVLRELAPGVPITTNFMGFFKPLDYAAWAKEVDFVSDDTYPDPADPAAVVAAAMERDLMRSLSDRPWILMEQSTSAVNWRDRNARKAPGQMRALSYQAVARGSDGVMFFQWRQARAGSEKFHSAMLPHVGTDSGIWREVTRLGHELGELGGVLGHREHARVGMFFSWDAWWALEQAATPADLDYVGLARDWYGTFYERNVPVDFVTPGADLDRLDVLVLPAAFVLEQDDIVRIRAFVERGGRLVATFQTGILDSQAHLMPGGYLGELAETLGVRVEEFAPLAGISSEALVVEASGEVLPDFGAALWSEVVHATDAEVLAAFADGPVPGGVAVTRRATRAGSAWYVATQPDAAGRSAIVEAVLAEAGIGVLPSPAGVEIVRRADHWFVVNQTPSAVRVDLPNEVREGTGAPAALDLDAYGVAVLRISAAPLA